MGLNIQLFGQFFVLGLCLTVSLQKPIAKREVGVGKWTKIQIPKMTEVLPDEKLQLSKGTESSLTNGNYEGPPYEEFVLNKYDLTDDTLSLSLTTKFPEMTVNYECAECSKTGPTTLQVVVAEIVVDMDARFIKQEDNTLDQGKVTNLEHAYKQLTIYINGQAEDSKTVQEQYPGFMQTARPQIEEIIEKILIKEMENFSDAFMITFKAGFEASAQLKASMEGITHQQDEVLEPNKPEKIDTQKPEAKP